MEPEKNRGEREVATVSACMITFNHEEFVAQAIEGVLAQRATFNYELIIGDDCSTDRTRSICEEYARNHDGKIRLQVAERNLGTMGNFLKTFRACRGEFVALCEGDDFWTDPGKLQKQIDALRARPDLAMAASSTTVLNQATQESYRHDYSLSEFTISDLIPENLLGRSTCSVVLRRSLIGECDLEVLAQAPFGDWALALLCLDKGNGIFLHDTMSCYRIHAKGAWSGLTEIQRRVGTLNMFDFIACNWPEHRGTAQAQRLEVQREISQLMQRRESSCG